MIYDRDKEAKSPEVKKSTQTEKILANLDDLVQISKDTLKRAERMKEYYKGTEPEPVGTGGTSGCYGEGFSNQIQQGISTVYADLHEIHGIINRMLED